MSDATFDDIPVAEPFEPRVSRSDRRRQRRVRSRIGRWWQQFVENRRTRREEALKAQDELEEPTTDDVDDKPSADQKDTKKADKEPDEDSPDTAFEERAQNRRNVIWGTVLILVALLVGCWLLNGLRSHQQYRTPTSKAGTAPEATAKSSAPVDDFVIAMPRRDGHRLNADGVKVHDDAKAFRDQIAEQAKHDPLTLYAYYNYSPLGKTDPIQNPADLCKDGEIQNGNVYSSEGRRRYNEWLTLWKVADIKSVREITFQGTNTGVDGKSLTQSDGVGGSNKAGYDINYRDAQGNSAGKHSALERCTQPTGGDHFPPGPTDNPPPRRRLEPKRPQDDPAPRGNAPIGGGRNEDPGPGTYIPPDQMEQPPATPRVNPPAPPAPADPPAGSTPDPTPPPPPEQPSQPPAGGTVTPPGGGSI